jgi:hypothetical protein
MWRISALSREFVRVAIESDPEVDPTSDPVALAVIAASSAPVEADWINGTWETDSDTVYARLEVGPGTTRGALTANVYDVWVKITDNPEVPVLRAGSIDVY